MPTTPPPPPPPPPPPLTPSSSHGFLTMPLQPVGYLTGRRRGGGGDNAAYVSAFGGDGVLGDPSTETSRGYIGRWRMHTPPSLVRGFVPAALVATARSGVVPRTVSLLSASRRALPSGVGVGVGVSVGVVSLGGISSHISHAEPSQLHAGQAPDSHQNCHVYADWRLTVESKLRRLSLCALQSTANIDSARSTMRATAVRLRTSAFKPAMLAY